MRSVPEKRVLVLRFVPGRHRLLHRFVLGRHCLVLRFVPARHILVQTITRNFQRRKQTLGDEIEIFQNFPYVFVVT
jgi:hypothetical protein